MKKPFPPKTPILGGDGDGDGRISNPTPPPIPSRPGIQYPVRAPLTPTIMFCLGTPDMHYMPIKTIHPCQSEGLPERDIESLGVMGWGLEAARRFFRRRRRPPTRGPGWDRLDSRRAERAPLRTGVIKLR